MQGETWESTTSQENQLLGTRSSPDQMARLSPSIPEGHKVISVEVWNEIRDPIVVAVMQDGFKLPDRVFDNDRYVLLRVIDPYGYTVFNQAQCAQLREEVLSLIPSLGRSDRAALEAILRLIDICVSEGHTYLVFDGD
jgi:hypothetical protein